MKTNAILYSAFALLAIACTKENLVENTENNNQNSEVEYTSLELYATIEGSKTELGEYGEVKWLNGDAISIFDTETGTNTKFTTTGNGWFTSETGVPVSGTYYALYYYRSAASWKSDVSAMQSKLFPDQIAKVGSFGNNVPYMAGKVDVKNKRIEFKNICSHIGFTLSEELANKGVKSLTLMGNNSETLCGTMQISIGDDGNPSVKVTDPDIYVRLHNNGKNLVAGTYYFSIVPQTFSEGFTVIVSKADGSQVAVKTENEITEVAKRNVILQMAEAPAEKYTDHMNYFVKYNDGFEISFGGQTISKDNYPKAYFTKDITIGQDGLYFIHSNGKANINYNTASNLVVIGSDKSSRSTITLSKSIQPANNGTLVLYANLNCVTEKRIIEQKTFESFGSFIISNCNYQITNRYGLLFNAKNSKIESVVIEDSNFGIETAGTNTDMYFINCGDKTSTINNLQVSNSILYSMNQKTTTIVDFRLIHAPNTTFENTDISNNTFVGLKTRIPTSTKSGLIYANCFNSKTILKYNYMVECQVTGTSSNSMIYLIYATKVGETFTRDFQHNYVYSSINERTMTFSDCFTINGKPQGVRKMTGSPLNSNWNPAKGIYGPYKQVTYGTGTDTVPTSVGAQRPDMVTEANTASYRYAPNELGSF